MSQIWKLPAIYVVENNGYSMGTSVRRHTVGEIYERAKGYGMKHAVFNGMDAFTVYENMKKIADDVRETSEPWFVEIRTYKIGRASCRDRVELSVVVTSVNKIIIRLNVDKNSQEF